MIEEILTIVRSLQRAYQEENDPAKSQHEAIQAAIRRGLSGTAIGRAVNLGNLGTPIYGGDHSDKADKDTKS